MDLPGRKPCNDIDASIACWYDMFLTCVDEFVPKVVIKDANRPPCTVAQKGHTCKLKMLLQNKNVDAN